MKRKQVILMLVAAVLILVLLLLHVVLSKNIGPIPKSVTKNIPFTSVRVYDTY